MSGSPLNAHGGSTNSLVGQAVVFRRLATWDRRSAFVACLSAAPFERTRTGHKSGRRSRGGPIGNRPQVGNPPHNRINNFGQVFWKHDGLSYVLAARENQER